MSAAEIVDASTAGVAALGVLLVATRSIGRSIWLLALQSALVGLVPLGVGLVLGVDHLVLAGLLAMGAKAVIVPAVLFLMLRGTALRVERNPYLHPRVGPVLAVLIVFASAASMAGITLELSVGGERAMAVAVAQVLTGLLLMMSRRKAISLLIGLFVFENGLALAAFALTNGMPLVVEIGILFDLLIVVGVGWTTTRRMISVIGSSSTDQLRSLRG